MGKSRRKPDKKRRFGKQIKSQKARLKGVRSQCSLERQDSGLVLVREDVSTRSAVAQRNRIASLESNGTTYSPVAAIPSGASGTSANVASPAMAPIASREGQPLLPTIAVASPTSAAG